MHAKRWLTAIVGIPLLLYLLGPAPRWAFHFFILLIAGVGLLEFYRMASPEIPVSLRVLSLICVFPLFYFILRGPLVMILPLTSLWIFMPAVLYLVFYRGSRVHMTTGIGKILFGYLYVCLPLSLLLFVEKYPTGELWILYLLSVVFGTDTGAYYTGKLLGRHKLCPSISPGKTWEGAAGGLIAGVASAVLFSRIPAFPHLGALPTALLGALLSVISQIGDLVESMIKRSHGVKDSGKILPGHGGMLDRIDGVLFGIPVLYFFLAWYLP